MSEQLSFKDGLPKDAGYYVCLVATEPHCLRVLELSIYGHWGWPNFKRHSTLYCRDKVLGWIGPIPFDKENAS